MWKNASLTSKLMSVVGTLFVLFTLILVAISYLSLNQAEREINRHVSTEVRAQIESTVAAKAARYAAQTETLLTTAHQIPAALAAQLTTSIEAQDSLAYTRAQAARSVRSLLDTQVTSSMYAQFETNQFDGNATQHTRGDQYSVPGTGSFEVYFIRNSDGTVQQIPIEDASKKHDTSLDEFGFRAAEWYLCNKEQKKPCISNPYQYEIRPGYSELMTSLTVPVIADGRFRGVVGADLNLPVLQERAEQLKASLYDGNAEVYLVSQNGMTVAATNAREKLARPFGEIFSAPSHSEQLLALGSSSDALLLDNMLYVSRPVSLSLPGVQWQLVVGVDKDAALAPIETTESLISEAIAALLGSQLIFAILAILAALSLIYVFTRSIIRPVKQVADRMEELAGQGGDLTQNIHIHSHAELIQLSQAFNHFREKVCSLLEEAKGACREVMENGEQSQHYASSTNEQIRLQQSEIDSVVTAITEMSQSAQDVARTAADAASNADNATQSVQNTEQEISRSAQTVKILSGDMQSASSAVQAVSQRSADIKSILDVIDAIADQTNLLALNAAIEAARAGDNGRGFSVVADEVRSLASKTAESVGEIGTVITALQQEVDSTVTIINTGNQRAEEAAVISQSALQKMQQTVTQIDEISLHMTQMASAAEEQSQVSEALNRNMVTIGTATAEVARNSQASEQSSVRIFDAVRALSVLLEKLKTH